MIAKQAILDELTLIETLYNKATDPRENLLYSKIAIIELCGWVEMSMDEIVNSCSSRHLRDASNLNSITNEVIGRTYGFQYNKHFRSMLIRLIGMIKVERVESRVDPVKLAKLKAQLNALKDPRNTVAHNPIIGMTLTLDAPSVTRNRVEELYEGLHEMNRKIRSLRF
ncbi:MAG: hypothetical protein B6D41_22320 [Chloroflexi bacterium UTCFX4]|jgi:hypothetical protein|nr:MAG: hypothetical protein B6D41_22320 [Chloroflexi bacterium UTCFX4]